MSKELKNKTEAGKTATAQKKKYVSPRVTAHSNKKDDQTLRINACDSFVP